MHGDLFSNNLIELVASNWSQLDLDEKLIFVFLTIQERFQVSRTSESEVQTEKFRSIKAFNWLFIGIGRVQELITTFAII